MAQFISEKNNIFITDLDLPRDKFKPVYSNNEEKVVYIYEDEHLLFMILLADLLFENTVFKCKFRLNFKTIESTLIKEKVKGVITDLMMNVEYYGTNMNEGGLVVAAYCKNEGIPFIIVTEGEHHANFEMAFQIIKAMEGYRVLFDDINKKLGQPNYLPTRTLLNMKEIVDSTFF